MENWDVCFQNCNITSSHCSTSPVFRMNLFFLRRLNRELPTAVLHQRRQNFATNLKMAVSTLGRQPSMSDDQKKKKTRIIWFYLILHLQLSSAVTVALNKHLRLFYKSRKSCIYMANSLRIATFLTKSRFLQQSRAEKRTVRRMLTKWCDNSKLIKINEVKQQTRGEIEHIF